MTVMILTSSGELFKRAVGFRDGKGQKHSKQESVSPGLTEGLGQVLVSAIGRD